MALIESVHRFLGEKPTTTSPSYITLCATPIPIEACVELMKLPQMARYARATTLEEAASALNSFFQVITQEAADKYRKVIAGTEPFSPAIPNVELATTALQQITSPVTYGMDVAAFFTSFVLGQVKAGVLPGGHSVTEVINFSALVQWARSGLPTFRLEENLVAALMMTEVNEETELRMPFESLVIRVPKDFFAVTKNSDANRGRESEAICANTILVARTDLIAAERSETETKLVEVPLSTLANDTSFGQKHCLSVSLYAAWKPLEHSMLRHGRFTTEATGIKEALKDMRIGPPSLAPDIDNENVEIATRLALNTIAYINSVRSTSLPATRNDHSTPNMRLESLTPKRWVLGSAIKLAPQVVVAAKAHSLAREGWQLKVRYVVRGHWRNQAHGPNHTLRKLMWIEPYWKGPASLEEAMLRTYNVET